MAHQISSSAQITHPLNYQHSNGPVHSQNPSGGIWRVLGLNDEQVASASYDHRARIHHFDQQGDGWDFSSELITLNQHKKEVLSLARLGNRLFSGSSDGRVCIWNIDDGTLLNTWKEKYVTGIYSMAVLDNDFLATGSCQRPKNHEGPWNHVIKIWDHTSQHYLYEMKGHDGGISALVKMNEQRVASCSADCTVRIWDLAAKTACAVLSDHSDYVYGMSLSQTGHLITASKDRTVRIWDIQQETQTGSLVDRDNIAHTSTIYDVKTQGDVAATASRDGYVKLWDLRTQKCITVLDPEDGYVYGVDFLPNGNVVAGTSGIQDGEKTRRQNANVVAWDFRTL